MKDDPVKNEVRYILGILMLLGLLACSKAPDKKVLSTPGFGIIEDQIAGSGQTVELPVLLNTDQDIKGLQFTLIWDPAIARVGPPQLTAENPDFTVSTGNGRDGRMKVLVFSMTSAIMHTENPVILTLPVTVIATAGQEVSIQFAKAVFAGPNAKSYTIPVTHAQLEVE